MPGTSPVAVSVSASAKLREAEVEQPHRDLLALGEEHVRGLDVAVDDPARVRVGERVEHLRRRLDGGRVVELAARIASRSVWPGTYS